MNPITIAHTHTPTRTCTRPLAHSSGGGGNLLFVVVGREEHDHAIGHDVAHVEHQPAQLLDLVEISSISEEVL
jgi:hypothetical protein